MVFELSLSKGLQAREAGHCGISLISYPFLIFSKKLTREGVSHVNSIQF